MSLLNFHLDPQPALPFHAAALFAEQALAASAGDWPGVRSIRDIAFGPERWQRFDVFAPEGEATGRDVVIFLHGGGWTHGYKEWCGLMAPGITARGALLVAPTYRLAPAHRYPVPVLDTLAAIAAIRSRIVEWGGDPDRLFLGGHSAGGHIAMQAALNPALWTDAPFEALKGCLPLSGILDLRHPAPPAGSLEARVYELVLADPSQDAEASPLPALCRLSVPTHFCWGMRDSARVRQSNEAARAMLGDPSDLASFHRADADHFGTQLALIDPGHRWYDDLQTMRDRPR
ncbi:alpha/beta hydrolase [Mesobacterium pallidum]|uniref:alpha/beta hydrolase n=1 Tax=Mesobacterium pallidum TaxID=2872037 RepID=UPI001EE2F49F|nr:alpha/beta hydrolase [Mesobacterium pallidum]